MNLDEAFSGVFEDEEVRKTLIELGEGKGLILGERSFFEDLTIDEVYGIAPHNGYPMVFTYQEFLNRKSELIFGFRLPETATNNEPYRNHPDASALLERVLDICNHYKDHPDVYIASFED